MGTFICNSEGSKTPAMAVSWSQENKFQLTLRNDGYELMTRTSKGGYVVKYGYHKGDCSY